LFAGGLFAQGDECTGALALVNGANGPFTNAGSTTSAIAWPCAAGGNDVWFSYVASCTGTVVIDTCGGTFDSALEVFDGTGGCGALVSIVCNDDSCGLQSSTSFAATAGTTYFVRMGGFGGATGSAPINVSCTVPPPNTLLTTFAGGNGGGVGGGVYFDLQVLNPAGITLTGMDLNFNEVAGVAGSVDVYMAFGTSRSGIQTTAGSWQLVASGTVTTAGFGLPSAVALANPVPMPAGTLAGVALHAIGVSHAYTNGTGGNQNYANADLSLAAGEASNLVFTAPLFTPRVVNGQFAYGIGTGGSLATAVNYGQGCVNSFTSFYEELTPVAYDLAGTGLTMINSGGAYTVLPALTAFQPTTNATALALGDDSEATVNLSTPFNYNGGSTTTLQVC
jgi:hypothetical protein